MRQNTILLLARRLGVKEFSANYRLGNIFKAVLLEKGLCQQNRHRIGDL